MSKCNGHTGCYTCSSSELRIIQLKDALRTNSCEGGFLLLEERIYEVTWK